MVRHLWANAKAFILIFKSNIMKDKSIKPSQLPESEAFTSKEANQYKRHSDRGKPVKENEKPDDDLTGKTFNRSSKEEGINEERSAGDAGAFEGFEEQGKGSN